MINISAGPRDYLEQMKSYILKTEHACIILYILQLLTNEINESTTGAASVEMPKLHTIKLFNYHAKSKSG